MNIHEIIHLLEGKKSGERRRLLVELKVDLSLWDAIMSCFNQEGKLLVTPKEPL